MSITQSRLLNNPSPISGIFSNLNFVSHYATHIREAVRKSLRTYQSPLEHTIECINDLFSIVYHIQPCTSHSNPSQIRNRKTYADSVRTSVKHQIPKTSLKHRKLPKSLDQPLMYTLNDRISSRNIQTQTVSFPPSKKTPLNSTSTQTDISFSTGIITTSTSTQTTSSKDTKIDRLKRIITTSIKLRASNFKIENLQKEKETLQETIATLQYKTRFL